MDLDVSNPIRDISDLDKALKIFVEEKSELLYSVTESRKNPYFNMVEIKGNNIKLSKDKNKFFRTQDLPKVYDINANIYIYSRDFLCRDVDSINDSKKTSIYVMDSVSAFDIDTELDFFIVDCILNRVKK